MASISPMRLFPPSSHKHIKEQKTQPTVQKCLNERQNIKTTIFISLYTEYRHCTELNEQFEDLELFCILLHMHFIDEIKRNKWQVNQQWKHMLVPALYKYLAQIYFSIY